MRKIDIVDWVMLAQSNLDEQGKAEFGTYKKSHLYSKNHADLVELKKKLEGILYEVGIRSEVKFNRSMHGKYF